MKKIGIKNIWNKTKNVCTSALTTLGVGVFAILGLASDSYSQNRDYYDAVEAIMNSDSYTCYKEDMIKALKPNENSTYYKTVISIVKSDGYSYEKLEMIKSLH